MSQYELQTVSPDTMGLCPERWGQVLRTAEQLCETGTLPALSLQVQRHGMTTGAHHFGSQHLDTQTAIHDHTLFLVASLTKPIVALATLVLIEHGALSLNQQAREFLPEIRDPAKRPITIRHLLTHTSGLPDMLPNNLELRASKAQLDQFVTESCQIDLQFPPGRSAVYQSMGYAWLGAIIEKISGMACRDFLERELFAPLGMKDSWLGLPTDGSLESRVAEVQLPAAMKDVVDGNWNSRYWRELGAPWGGILSTCADLSRFLHMVLQGLRQKGERCLLSRAALQESLQNQLREFSSIPEAEARVRGWGLGWRFNWKDHRTLFSDLLPASAVGHWGATGTLFWLDPHQEMAAVLLSTRPPEEGVSPLTTLSNQIVAAFRTEV